MTRLKALLTKEFIQMRRDRLTLAIMLLMPIIQLTIFGFAINTDVKHLKTAVFDQSLSAESRDLLDGFTASEYFDIHYVCSSYAQVNQLIEDGSAKIGIIIPPDLTANLKHASPTPIQVIVDASDSMSASSAIATAQSLGQLKSQEQLLKNSGYQAQQPPLYDVRVRAWYNQDFVTVYYMVPGIMGILLTMTMVMITSMAIVRERENGTLEQLIVTPLKPAELMLGKIVPYVFVGYIQTTVAIIIGVVMFDMPLRGSLPLLYALTSLFLLCSLALGILISTVANTQMQAMQMSFFIFMPSVLLSGFMFPRDAMPLLFRLLSTIIPLTHYLEILRGIILKGNGISMLWTQVLALTVFLTAILSFSIKKFRKTLD